ncbi:hypothetical protein [Dietzia timorensis]|uniref:Uncharacterized protein n=1 Tax=Dietzia timorensis TaxID=499555 RepID=A0A173LG70_9ACTN|nr:hypothetical protein [Dietzia timorensis]ANI91225.1 Hypothetical protein BJL86_0415 [Dietzia timorensis]
MTATLTDPWIERQITAGRLAPGARGMSRTEAAEQYNQANSLTESDDDYLYTPGQAQQAAHDALAVIGIETGDARILLSDGRPGPRCWSYLVEPGQLEFALDQHRLTTGASLSADAVMEALPWF